MPSDQQKPSRWLVIIEKKPRGPLNEAEVRTLMAEGVLRTNDLALLVLDEETTAVEWKFLWQYPEFDRRKPTAAPATPKDERRAQDPEKIQATLKEKKAEISPEDLKAISPEQLSLHSSGPTAMDFNPPPLSNVLEFPSGNKKYAPEPDAALDMDPPKVWKYLGVLSLTVFAFALLTTFVAPKFTPNLAPSAPYAPTDAAENVRNDLPSGNPLKFGTGALPRDTASSPSRTVPLPTAKAEPREVRGYEDRGDILKDNREKEFSGWRERDEEEDDQAAEEDAEIQPKKRPKKAKPKKRSLDTEEEYIGGEADPDSEVVDEVPQD